MEISQSRCIDRREASVRACVSTWKPQERACSCTAREPESPDGGGTAADDLAAFRVHPLVERSAGDPEPVPGKLTVDSFAGRSFHSGFLTVRSDPSSCIRQNTPTRGQW